MFVEMIRLAGRNIAGARLRYVLTMFGIMIGTGAIVSMVSYAVGMQKHVSDTVASSGLLTTIYVLPGREFERFGHDPSDPDDVGTGPAEMERKPAGRSPGTRDQAEDTRDGQAAGTDAADEDTAAARTSTTAGPAQRPPITDELVNRISSIEGVEYAFPVVAFPAILTRGPHSAVVTVSGLPAQLGGKLRKRLEQGEFFYSETDSTVLVSPSLARRLGMSPDSFSTPVPVTLTVVTLARRPSLLFAFGVGMPFEKRSYGFMVGGILKETGASPLMRRDAYVPLGIARDISELALQEAGDILRNLAIQAGGYMGAEVHVSSMNMVESVSDKIEKMGLSAFSVSDQLKEVRTAFLVLSGFLGIIGGVALLVGCLGIVNVMLISVFERTRDIGVMKSVGARKRDVMNLFVIEAAFIGVTGGLLGILLGWLVAELTNHMMFSFVIKGQIPYQRFYEIPLWLAVGALALASSVSILAGLYPARRAAKLDPVAALRYE